MQVGDDPYSTPANRGAGPETVVPHGTAKRRFDGRTAVVYDAHLPSGRTATASIVEEIGRFHVLISLWEEGSMPGRAGEDEIVVVTRAALSNRRVVPLSTDSKE